MSVKNGQPEGGKRSSLGRHDANATATPIRTSSSAAHQQHTNYGSIISSPADDHSGDSTTSTTIGSSSMSPHAGAASSRLQFTAKLGYGLGHVYNDLCAGVWFSYTLLFMQNALGMASAVAGGLVMVGQVGDALATPLIGWLADRYGTKRQWHIGGTLTVFLSFPLIFSWCPWCADPLTPGWWQPMYFTIVVLAFQLGWAIVQVTHLAMIPEFARQQSDRADLTAIRYSASVCSSVVVYVVMWLVLSDGGQNRAQHITPADAFRFRDVSLILTLIGVSMSVCFHLSLAVSGYASRRQQALDSSNIARPPRRRSSDPTVNNDRAPLIVSASSSGVASSSSSTATSTPLRRNFFRSPLLYQNAFLYVFSRLFCTTALVYIPLWLDERSWTPAAAVAATPFGRTRYGAMSAAPIEDANNGGNVAHIAIIPLVSFVASFVGSVLMKVLNRWVGPKCAYLIGSTISVGACLWVALQQYSASWELYAIASLFGLGSSVTMISSLCITADMIGQHADQSGFIYSAVTFADKLITGVVVIVIESLKCQSRSECPEYYRHVLAYACLVAALGGIVTLITLLFTRRMRYLSPYARV